MKFMQALLFLTGSVSFAAALLVTSVSSLDLVDGQTGRAGIQWSTSDGKKPGRHAGPFIFVEHATDDTTRFALAVTGRQGPMARTSTERVLQAALTKMVSEHGLSGAACDSMPGIDGPGTCFFAARPTSENTSPVNILTKRAKALEDKANRIKQALAALETKSREVRDAYTDETALAVFERRSKYEHELQSIRLDTERYGRVKSAEADAIEIRATADIEAASAQTDVLNTQLMAKALRRPGAVNLVFAEALQGFRLPPGLGHELDAFEALRLLDPSFWLASVTPSDDIPGPAVPETSPTSPSTGQTDNPTTP
ncbi:MAG: hypothetical protein VX589_13725 [Myxococcota bacterium]|nr:hypothetical protein [Myxococcota bacterium]